MHRRRGQWVVNRSGPRDRPAPVRISDVADRAGVSVATVSKALNGRPDVSEATRDRVRDIAQQLGFQPNVQARSLPTGRSFAVGLLTTDVYGRFSLPLLLGAEDEFGNDELALIFCDTRADDDRELRQLRQLIGRQVDGIVVNGRRIGRRAPLPDTGGIPVVYALTGSTDPSDCSVMPDEAGGAVLALTHFLESGRRRIAHVTGPRRHSSAGVRARAVTQHLNEHGLAVRGRVRFGSWTEAWGREVAAALLDDVPDVDAVLCGSDQIARGVLDVLRERGRTVPADIAVIGFDNWAPMVEAARPALTSVDLNIDTIGRIAARHLVTAIDGKRPPHETVVPARLVIRGSA
jgi:LacI family transcriptional regulator